MTRLYLLIGGAAVVASLAGALWWVIEDNANLRAERDGLRGYIETRKGIDNADIGHGDPADDTDWLRERSGR
ncbi:hypothetical protein [Oceaniglobus trochenteri]|uniref:hypothetical protein n=1 Tax=Oceaniglobus trochenteri TaxID=2763260 RepID=UPI001CFFFBDD|nr:hypothetical protein [Oceaniglobus trochenteri]